MKNLLCWLLLALPTLACAQEHAMRVNTPPISFDSAAKVVMLQMTVAEPDDTTEGGDINAFRRWTNFWSNRACNDAPADSSILIPAGKALWSYLNNTGLFCDGAATGTYTGNWQCLGPFNDYYGYQEEKQGRIDAIWADPDDMGHILAGANMGGLWRSTDTGHTWVNITDPTLTNGALFPIAGLSLAQRNLNQEQKQD